MDRHCRAALQLSADSHIVRGCDFHKLLGIGLVPLLCLGADHARHPGEVASHEAQGVNDVSVGDGQGCLRQGRRRAAKCCSKGVPTCHRAWWSHDTRAPRPHKPASICSLTYSNAGLTRDCRPTAVCTPLSRARAASSSASAVFRPKGHSVKDVLAGFDGGLRWLIVRWHSHNHGHRVDLRRRCHCPEIMEGELRSKRLASLFRALGPGGANCGKLDIRTGQ